MPAQWVEQGLLLPTHGHGAHMFVLLWRDGARSVGRERERHHHFMRQRRPRWDGGGSLANVLPCSHAYHLFD